MAKVGILLLKGDRVYDVQFVEANEEAEYCKTRRAKGFYPLALSEDKGKQLLDYCHPVSEEQSKRRPADFIHPDPASRPQGPDSE